MEIKIPKIIYLFLIIGAITLGIVFFIQTKLPAQKVTPIPFQTTTGTQTAPQTTIQIASSTQGQIDTSELKKEIEKLLTREDGKGPIAIEKQFGTSAVPILLEIIKPDYSPTLPELKEIRLFIRRGAIYALGFIGDKRSVKPLISILETKSEELIIRGTAVYSLGYIGDKEALNSLINALYDEEFYIREEAIKALVKLNDPRAIPALEEISQKDPKIFIKNKALKAIEQIKEANK